MKILDLVLKGNWYDMIASGEKPEEYREIKPYWEKRLMKCLKWCGRNLDKCLHKKNVRTYSIFVPFQMGYTHVRFRRGYTNITMLFKCDGITIGKGNPQWGAPTDKEVFIIKLGNRL